MTVYRLFWDEFSSWYLEMVKPEYGKPIDKVTYEATLDFFENLLKMLHPFMPFITEELWQHIFDRKNGESIMDATMAIGTPHPTDHDLCADMEYVKQVVSGVRTVRNQKNIAQKEQLELQAVGRNHYEAYNSIIAKMGNVSDIKVVSDKAADSSAFMVGTYEFAVPVGNLIDVNAEIEKQEKELKHLEGFLMGIKKKLANDKFVAHAPADVVARERKKQSDSEKKIAMLKESIVALKNA